MSRQRLTSLRCCGGLVTQTSQCQWDDNAAPSVLRFHPENRRQTRHRDDLQQKKKNAQVETPVGTLKVIVL